MTDIFIKILNLSLVASAVILAVLFFRFFLKRYSRRAVCMLWLIVALRLIIPFSAESSLGIMPANDLITSGNEADKSTVDNPDSYRAENFVIPDIDSYQIEEPHNITENAELPNQIKPESRRFSETRPSSTTRVEYNKDSNQNPNQDNADTIHDNNLGINTSNIDIWSVLAWGWIGGAICMLVYMMISYIVTYRRTRVSILHEYVESRVYICSGLSSPFVLGVLHPAIYLPDGLTDKQAENIIAHERTHIARMDHIRKLAGFALVCVYWFNPLMWMSYAIFCKDIEYACDEQVITGMGVEEIRNYSQTLLMCAAASNVDSKRPGSGSLFSDFRSIFRGGCPTAFGEIAVKDRIKAVLNYKKPAFWIIVSAAVISVGLGIIFMTKAPENKDSSGQDYAGSTTNTDNNGINTAQDKDNNGTDITKDTDRNDPGDIGGNNANVDGLNDNDHEWPPKTDSEHLLDGVNCYVSYCVDYMSPLSSVMRDDDTGEFYYFFKDKMIIGGKYDRTIYQQLDMISDKWEDYHNDTEKWLEKHAMDYAENHRTVDTGFSMESDSMENARILRYEGNYCIIALDKTLWLVRFAGDPMDEGSQIWSMYAILPTSVEYFDRDRFTKLMSGEEITVGQTVLTKHIPTSPESSIYNLLVFFLDGSPRKIFGVETLYGPLAPAVYSNDHSFKVGGLLDFIDLNDSRNLCYAYERYNRGVCIVGDSYESATEKKGSADEVFNGYQLLLSYIETWPYVRLENEGLNGYQADEANGCDAVALFPASLRDKEGNGYELYIAGSRLYLYKIEDSFARSTQYLYGYHGGRETFVAAFSFENGFEPDMDTIRGYLFGDEQWSEYKNSL